jgi:prepilin-type N-terminal cleavage/methylation domain-containing protein
MQLRKARNKSPLTGNFYCQGSDNAGFTLMEIVVATTIFASAVTLMLTLFNQTLQIYRKTEGIRQATQSVRATLEFIVKEVRNGTIDYNQDRNGAFLSSVGLCKNPIDPNIALVYDPSGLIDSTQDKKLAYISVKNVDNERECIYWQQDANLDEYDAENNNIYIKKEKLGLASASSLNPPNVKFVNVKFIVSPPEDPYANPIQQIQPFVTILAIAKVKLPTGEIFTLPYQTSVSTYAYDIPTE